MGVRVAVPRRGPPLTDASRPPEAVSSLLAERAAARAERDWAAADALRDRIRELGWDPVDGPSGWAARPWLPAVAGPDLAPRIDEPASLRASVVLIVDDHPDDLARFLSALGRHPLPGEAGADRGRQRAERRRSTMRWRSGPDSTVLRSPTRLGWADAANLGMRRGIGAVIVLVNTSLEPDGDWLSPLLAAFDDATVGIAGGWGVQSGDGRHFSEAQPGEVDAVEGYCLAVRREALRQAGGFDHRFRWYRNADLDLSFSVRAAGWRAVQTDPLPLLRHEHRDWSALPDDERDRLSKRNFYRFLKRWGDRRDLLLHPERDEPRLGGQVALKARAPGRPHHGSVSRAGRQDEAVAGHQLNTAPRGARSGR